MAKLLFFYFSFVTSSYSKTLRSGLGKKIFVEWRGHYRWMLIMKDSRSSIFPKGSKNWNTDGLSVHSFKKTTSRSEKEFSKNSWFYYFLFYLSNDVYRRLITKLCLFSLKYVCIYVVYSALLQSCFQGYTKLFTSSYIHITIQTISLSTSYVQIL